VLAPTPWFGCWPPLGRQGTVDEIAGTCLFVVSEDGGFITGQTIHVNGGALLLICGAAAASGRPPIHRRGVQD
jgi:NAD(P)-dependent dehydrogenase (short-subunit alcohol dehydrogenase family)